MREPKKGVIRLGIIAVLVGIFCMPLVSSASGPTSPATALLDLSSDPQVPDGLSTEGIPDAGAGPEGIIKATPWGTPVQLSPNNGTAFYHYPRATTLAWLPVTRALRYRVEREYLSGSTWVAYPSVYVSGFSNASYTFNFIGDQTCRWRVTAFDGRAGYTPRSPWWTFSYRTKAQMPTPVQTNPYSNEAFDHYPRTTTLSWKMAPAAVGYKLEIAYCTADRGTCWYSTPITITDPLKSYYTFDFVGAQPGKWRVTTLGAPTYLDSIPSAWSWFSYSR